MYRVQAYTSLHQPTPNYCSEQNASVQGTVLMTCSLIYRQYSACMGSRRVKQYVSRACKLSVQRLLEYVDMLSRVCLPDRGRSDALTPDALSLSADKDSGGKSVMAGIKGGCSSKIYIIMHTTYLYSMIPYIYISASSSAPSTSLTSSVSSKARGLYD